MNPPSKPSCDYGTETDERLMQAAAGGDLQAFEQIVLRYQRCTWNVAYRFLKDSEAAEDVVQEAFLRVWEVAPRYRVIAKFRTYLFRIVSRLCLDQIRKKRPIQMDAIPEPPDPSPLAIDIVLEAERAVAVQCALQKLPPRQQLAIILRYYEQCSYMEIAEVLEVSEKAAERLLARGKAALETLLGTWR